MTTSTMAERPTGKSPAVTALLQAWREGDSDAYNQLFEILSAELHRLARNCMAGERPGHTLQPTALVNEAYLRLLSTQRIDWQDRAHFMAMAARIMRRILVERARARRSQKRDGGRQRVTLDEVLHLSVESGRPLVALDDALTALSVVDQRKSRVVELRFFGGLDLDETAAVLGVSRDTVKRDWKFAKVWLLREINLAVT
jgi:RNA polymerase sigma factor (TIGR02999 family)